MDEILTASQVAEYLKLSKAKIYYLIQKRQIPHIKIGRNVRIKQSELIKYLDKQEVKVLG